MIRREQAPPSAMGAGIVLFSLWALVGGCDQSSAPTAVQAGPKADSPAAESVGTGPAAAESRPKIVAFGDSLTAGLGVAPEETYPAQLQRRLDGLGQNFHVINAGVSGDTTAGGLRRIDWVLKSHPRIVIVELGANDGLRGIDPAHTRSNLDRIIQKLKAAGVTVLLTGMKLPPNYGHDYIQAFEGIYPELARRHGVDFMPFFLEGVAAQRTLNQADGIHPTAEGYRVVVDHLIPLLEQAVKAGTGEKHRRA